MLVGQKDYNCCGKWESCYYIVRIFHIWLHSMYGFLACRGHGNAFRCLVLDTYICCGFSMQQGLRTKFFFFEFERINSCCSAFLGIDFVVCDDMGCIVSC